MVSSNAKYVSGVNFLRSDWWLVAGVALLAVDFLAQNRKVVADFLQFDGIEQFDHLTTLL